MSPGDKLHNVSATLRVVSVAVFHAGQEVSQTDLSDALAMLSVLLDDAQQGFHSQAEERRAAKESHETQ